MLICEPGECHQLPRPKFTSSSSQKPKQRKQPATFSPLNNVPAKRKVTFKMHISGNKSCLKRVHEKPYILHIFLHRELGLGREKSQLVGFLPAELYHLRSTNGTPSPIAGPSAHTRPSSFGLRFLKAPRLLALAMNSFSRSSICSLCNFCQMIDAKLTAEFFQILCVMSDRSREQ